LACSYRPRPWPHCVRWGPSSPAPRGGDGAPQFSAHICYGQMAGWIKMPFGMEEGLGPGDFVRWGPRSPPQFSAHVHCDQTAGWIKMARGIEVGLGPGNSVLDWNPAPLPKNGGRSPLPIFGPFLLWPNGWMHQDTTRYGGRLQPRRVCIRWGPSPSPKRGRNPLPNFKG